MSSERLFHVCKGCGPHVDSIFVSCSKCKRFLVPCGNQKKDQCCHHHRVIFTDGACSSNGKQGATAGLGIAIGSKGSEQDQWSIPVDDVVDANGRRTSQRAELLAAIYGLRLVGSHDRDTLCPAERGSKYLYWIIATDSQYVVKGMTEWFDNWKVRSMLVLSCFLL
ncbi:uncharacterized protein LAESUDRAFT_723610 [Laetiporus sulphureus 93-53]|uniref:ribonuclease H n=1 Tax=Laetiporus sulphureus 93-53 TaxID=1314785 RepID=A0A165FB56_9APHY|nr:uncharacterized protein LAESUDRAFT_723610 [Laetiporus sulphureus 93-53]KZT08701.1 hypothetical protein LAESUDRAFT_723610 [Laetiporus sulphureus 93-53]